MTTPPQILGLVFNHIALPSKLPGKHDGEADAEGVERDLTRRLLDAVKSLKDSFDDETKPAWDYVEKSLKTCNLVKTSGFVNKALLRRAFEESNFDNNAVIIHVGLQNAALLVRQSQDDPQSVIFEAFETSPSVEQTLASQGALQWDFPGVAISLPLNEFEDPVFQENLATFIEKASSEPIEEFSAKSRKTGMDIVETRDTVDPAIITQFLMTLLETNGPRINLPLLRKRVKDDVCWDKAELPWRRSPFWLTLRVSVQRLLYLRLGYEIGRPQYKFLMCSLLARLLVDSVDVLSSEERKFLNTKLCRRLAKLEIEKEKSSETSHSSYVHLLAVVGPTCQQSIDIATADIETKWKAFKAEFKRKVPPLPLRTSHRDLRLALPNCSSFLNDILEPPKHHRTELQTIPAVVIGKNASKNTPEQFADLTGKYGSLTELEWKVESEIRKVPKQKTDCETLCTDLASRIDSYLRAVGQAYDSDPEQMSIFILTIFELWVDMDKCAAKVFPLLNDYLPGFNPELLDVLLLSRLTSMKRLQEIQLYLQHRCAQAQMVQTIFAGPLPGCFAERYLDIDAAQNLREREQTMETASLRSRNAKKAELERINAEYESLVEKKAISSCTQRQHPDGTRDIRGCSYCYCIRRRRHLKIEVHEDYLPSETNSAQRRAVVFELGIPKCYVGYNEHSVSQS